MTKQHTSICRRLLTIALLGLASSTVIGCASMYSSLSEEEPQPQAMVPTRLVAGDSFGAAAFRLDEERDVRNVAQFSDADTANTTTP